MAEGFSSKFTPEEENKFEESRALTVAELIKGEAHYVEGRRLEVTLEQIDKARQEMKMAPLAAVPIMVRRFPATIKTALPLISLVVGLLIGGVVCLLFQDRITSFDGYFTVIGTCVAVYAG
jgi:hypothetical protein